MAVAETGVQAVVVTASYRRGPGDVRRSAGAVDHARQVRRLPVCIHRAPTVDHADSGGGGLDLRFLTRRQAAVGAVHVVVVGERRGGVAHLRLGEVAARTLKDLDVLDVGHEHVRPGHVVRTGDDPRDVVPRPGIHLVVVLDVHLEGNPDLLDVAQAGGLPGLLTRAGEDGEQDGRQDRDDRDDDQQLDERESLSHLHPLLVCRFTRCTSTSAPPPLSDTLPTPTVTNQGASVVVVSEVRVPATVVESAVAHRLGMAVAEGHVAHVVVARAEVEHVVPPSIVWAVGVVL